MTVVPRGDAMLVPGALLKCSMTSIDVSHQASSLYEGAEAIIAMASSMAEMGVGAEPSAEVGRLHGSRSTAGRQHIALTAR